MERPVADTRRRSAEATRERLLEAAVRRFAREGYDNASLRDIASDAGVDVALVSRYFGGKDELFGQVISQCPPPEGMFEGDHASFGERVARMLLDDPVDGRKLDYLMIMLRSASSPKASETLRQTGQEMFFGPLAEWLGGEAADVRARLAGAIIKGVVVDRVLDESFGLSTRKRTELRKRLARLLQAAIEA